MNQDASLTEARLRSLLEYRDFKSLRLIFKDSELADIAEVFSDLTVSETIALLRLVPRARRSDLFSFIELERQEELVSELPDVIVSSLLNEMEPDNRTKLLEALSEEIRNKIMMQLDPEERQVASQLLSYPEDSIGRLMTSDCMRLHVQMTISQALDYIRWSSALPLDYLHYLFVVNDAGHLIGEISLAALVVSDPISLKVADIMTKNHVALFPEEDATVAIETFRKYDRHYIPVITTERVLLGIVTADDAFDIAEEEATEDIQQFGGHAALEESYFQTPIWTMIRKRAGWLAILFVGGFFSIAALKTHQEVLSQWKFLTVFLTIIISTGGNSGTQAASLIIRGLAINEMSMSDWWKVLLKELSIGLILGIILATIGFGKALSLGFKYQVGLVVASSILIIVLFGVCLGSMLPFLFKKIRFDPAVVSSPFITTVVDATGILIFIYTTIWLMEFFGAGGGSVDR